MSTDFQEQGGAATMDPSPLRRWLTSTLMTRLFSAPRMDRRRAAAEKQRLRQGLPHRVEYFHQVDDGYSQLAAQLLQPLLERYDIELVCHLVGAPRGKNAAEPELQARLSRYDAFHIAPGYGLHFPDHPEAPSATLLQMASAILAAQDSGGFVDCAAEVGSALWAGDAPALRALTEARGRATAEETEARLSAGSRRRAELGHYAGAMFYYAGEWYWGVDRLYHLEQRLASLGADRRPGAVLLAPRPAIDPGAVRDNGTLTLEFYPSLRSPYTAIVFDRVVALAGEAGVKLSLRPVLPMVMRGVPATREKGMYIFMDAAREARAAGVPYGNFYDPIGDPVRRCYSLYPWAEEQDRGAQLLSSFLRHAFVLGVNTGTERGLRQVVEGAGLDWSEAQRHLGEPGWEEALEANRLAMYASGLWGVPSFRLLDSRGKPLLALWGQDRLWRIARAIREQLQQQ